ncbi:NACHT, LRR and PYD domains-containing protein 3-like [Eucyclogobius newberryi]|uniref:NACHT, LRR and PYD domains-containing protein 3-like n=1 Tax=Eucyclogobius newberryi TaxID=166745 RepID=UPI003B5CCD27
MYSELRMDPSVEDNDTNDTNDTNDPTPQRLSFKSMVEDVNFRKKGTSTPQRQRSSKENLDYFSQTVQCEMGRRVGNGQIANVLSPDEILSAPRKHFGNAFRATLPEPRKRFQSHGNASRATKMLPEPRLAQGFRSSSGLSVDSEHETERPDDNKDQRCSAIRLDSMNTPIVYFNVRPRSQEEEKTINDELDSVFKEVEDRIACCVRRELSRLRQALTSDYPECSELRRVAGEPEAVTEAVLSLALRFLRDMNRGDVAERLQSAQRSTHCREELKSKLQQRFQSVFEGVAKAGSPALLKQIYTELHISEGGAADVNQEHEVRQIETDSRKRGGPETTIACEDIFKGPAQRPREPMREELTGELPPIRTVLTKGVAGIGKTVLTQKFSLDWAEGRANRDVHLLFPFTFRALNVLRDASFSLEALLQHFFGDQYKKGVGGFEQLQNKVVVFILDGLDECRLTLDFSRSPELSDPTVSASLEVLLVNLIRGTLLPSARLWITTRPAAASQIPPQYVSMVTEVRGFTDVQKEQYFRMRFRDGASAVIAHIKTCRSLYIMCHMPMFCWITATVLEHVLKSSPGGELPRTLTQLYVHYLVVQAKVTRVKYEGGCEGDRAWTPERRRTVEGLGKLAFEQLQKGNLIFYESDLKDSDISPAADSVHSGVFTQVFREEPGLYQDKVYCFVHLSVQEFMAALYVYQSFLSSGFNLLSTKGKRDTLRKAKVKLKHLHRAAIDQALDSPNGHLDLFLRFLLGLALPTNQSLLQGLLSAGQSSTAHLQDTAEYIKSKIHESNSAERSLNLFHCLNELNDSSLLDQVQRCLSSGGLSRGKDLSQSQWSALNFILLSSEQELEVFELRKYLATEEALQRLLPVVQASRKAVLSSCSLSDRSCGALSSLISSSSSLTHLDLSNNPVKDSGIRKLCDGLKSAHCRLEQLRLCGCLISGEGCVFLASALMSNPSHLKELDLSYNHPGLQGTKFLRDLQTDPHYRLETLRLEPGGAHCLKPGPRRYLCSLSLDPSTAHPRLQLSDRDAKASLANVERPYPDLPGRFDRRCQILCAQTLPERSYWEVRWSGEVYISVACAGIARKGETDHCLFGFNKLSWSLSCSEGGFSVWHDKNPTHLLNALGSRSGTVAVYVDRPAGSLSFYKVSSDQLTHLYTCNAAFREPLVPGFSLYSIDSSVTLCDLTNG